jgi:hypothetical protein
MARPYLPQNTAKVHSGFGATPPLNVECYWQAELQLLGVECF